ncbi:hypothetical protein H0E87_013854 [Populus deltoides]|uniref:Uncharacterized protein n=1 Tax=Populus deltoides TaxID=3696 RepID=A0A8T2YAW7_POPDE|nr:hypothetical protein H0E87_013854 [Populus deltoides]
MWALTTLSIMGLDSSLRDDMPQNEREQKPNKAPSTENKQKPRKSRPPSNWDRCGDDDEDEFGVKLENPHGDNLKKPNFEDDGLVLPKRKGADFQHLLDEALSKCHQVDNFPSLEDFLAVYVYFETSSQFRLQRKRSLRLCPYLQEMSVASAKTTSTAATQDDVLDDLLEETSNLSNQNNLHEPLEMKAASYEIQSSSLRLSVSRKFWIDFDASSDTI